MDSTGAPSPRARPANDPLSSSIPLFDPTQMPLRTWCAGSREDAVTGLVAFPDFHSNIPRNLVTALAQGSVVGLAIGDVDGLKAHVEKSNAAESGSYGHLAGNKVMAQLGAVTRAWFHHQSWLQGCAATFGGDEVIIAAAPADAAAFHRAITDLRDRLAEQLPIPVSFALALASAEHLPARRDAGGWKHTFTDDLLAEVDRCLFTCKAARRASSAQGGVVVTTHPPLPAEAPPSSDATALIPLPTGAETLHVLARPAHAGTRGMLMLPCAGPPGLRGLRLRVTFPDGTARTAVAVSLHGQAAIPATTASIHQSGIPLALTRIREKSARRMPADLTAALERTGLDWSVLPAHEQTQMLHLIAESATDDVRAARITAALDAVATRAGS